MKFSKFYEVGSATVDVTEDTSVSIRASFSAQSPEVFSGCPGYSGAQSAAPVVAAGTSFSGGALSMSGGVSVSAVKANIVIGSSIFFPTTVGSVSGGSGSNQIKLLDGVQSE
jgi:hypothetical protein